VSTAPRIGIVTPSFNQARFLGHTLRSVAGQGMPVEHVVADGGSTDGSVELLRAWREPHFRWLSERDRGQTDALNKGMGLLTTEVAGWINSDDYFLPGAFARVLARFDAPDRPEVVFGYSVAVDDRGEILREARHDDFSLGSLVSLGFDVSQQALFWRRTWNDRVMPLDDGLRFCMDVQLVSRLARAGARFARLPAFLGAFRIHGGSKTSTIQDVCQRERKQIQDALRTEVFSAEAPPSTAKILVARRLHFLARGELRYALLGGGRPGPEARSAVRAAASAWAEPEGSGSRGAT
jgi:glycosyltransferase involved in cell wall biosynthesis